MIISLSTKDKIGFVTGSIKPPSSTDDSFPSWQRYGDLMVIEFHSSKDSQ